MKLAIVYVMPLPGNDQYREYAARFATTYGDNGPGLDHDTVIVCNGGKPDGFVEALFSGFPNVHFLEHDNSGWDIGGFQAAAKAHPCDLMVFFGVSAWFTRPSWLKRVLEASQRLGLGLYGTHGNQGDSRVNVAPHVRTTGFWCNPALMNQYPMRVREYPQRYQFEHGPNCFCNWLKTQNYPTYVIAWIGEYTLLNCDNIPNGFHRGNQENLIFRDRLTEPPFYG